MQSNYVWIAMSYVTSLCRDTLKRLLVKIAIGNITDIIAACKVWAHSHE